MRSPSGILDWTAAAARLEHPFVAAVVQRRRRGRRLGRGRERPAVVDTAEYASRRIVGIVFVVLSFLTLVFYGLWVASGVVAEKASRVMELLISAATAPQLVIGKISGIGLAGLTQVPLVLAARAWPCCSLSGRLGDVAARARTTTAAPSLGGPVARASLLAFLVYFTLGFALYAALYAGAGSLLSRAGGPPDRSPCRCRSPRSWATSRPSSRCPAAPARSSGSRPTCRCGARS